MAQTDTIEAYGNKPVSEIMGRNVRVIRDGVNMTVVGHFPKVEGWADLPTTPDQQSGHYFAFTFDSDKYLGKSFTYKRDGEVISSIEESTEDEMFWVLRLDGRQNVIYEFEIDGALVARFNFNRTVLD